MISIVDSVENLGYFGFAPDDCVYLILFFA
jgi:hypothetical protein